MANHKSSVKRIRQTIVRAERNRFYRTRLKNIVKDVRAAVEAGSKEEATSAMGVANKQIQKICKQRLILKKETAARKISRLHRAVNAL